MCESGNNDRDVIVTANNNTVEKPISFLALSVSHYYWTLLPGDVMLSQEGKNLFP